MTPFKDLPPHSRVWIYQSTREFTLNEVELIKKRAEEFVGQWTSHDQLMKASIEIFHNRFVIACVDEKTAPASGCGIDKSVKFIQALEKEFNISLLDRMNVAYRKSLTPSLSPSVPARAGKGEGEKSDKIFSCNVSELKNLGNITVFNNLVSTKEEFDKNWETPIEKSWHKKFIV